MVVALPLMTAAQPSPPSAPAHPNATSQSPAANGEEQARAHFRLGRAYYDNGDFVKAATEFEAAYGISQRSALLYNLYLAYRDASDLPHAAKALRSYLDLEANVENRGQLTARLAALERSLADQTPPAAPTTVPVAAPAVESTHETIPTPPDAAAKPVVGAEGTPLPTQAAAPPTAAPASTPEPVASAAIQRSQPTRASQPSLLWPVVLMSSGGALIAGSVVTGLLALGKRSELADAEDTCKRAGNCNGLAPARVHELQQTRSTGRTFAIVTDVLLFGGIAAAVTGATLFLLAPNGEPKDQASDPRFRAALSCSPGQCGGQVELHFD
jgi:tetratricopeptide (TPR) repeat protein